MEGSLGKGGDARKLEEKDTKEGEKVGEREGREWVKRM